MALLAGLLVTALAPGRVAAQDAPTPAPTWDPTTIDPTPVDTEYPPDLALVSIPIEGTRINAHMYLADGPGPHATVLFLPDVPGAENNLDFAQAVRRAGYNALVLRYRGTWGSGGEFSWSGMSGDVTAAIDFLGRPEVAGGLRVDPTRIHLVGAGIGLWAAVAAAEQRPVVECIAGLAAYDPAVIGSQLADGGAGEWRAMMSTAAGPDGPIRVSDAEVLLRDLSANAGRYGLAAVVGGVRDNPVALLTSAFAESDPASQTTLAAARFAGAGAATVERLIINDDANFSSSRVRVGRSLVQWLERRCPAW